VRPYAAPQQWLSLSLLVGALAALALPGCADAPATAPLPAGAEGGGTTVSIPGVLVPIPVVLTDTAAVEWAAAPAQSAPTSRGGAAASHPQVAVTDIRKITKGFSQLRAVNSAGQVTGTDFSVGRAAFRWQPERGFTPLPPLAGHRAAEAYDINAAGHVAGRSDNLFIEGLLPPPAAECDPCAVVWDEGGRVTPLGTLGGPSSEARGLNDRDLVVGSSETAAGDTHAFQWDAASGMRDLGTLGGRSSGAAAVNDAGQVVGWSERPDGTAGAFLWEAGRGMRDIGDFTPSAINAAGQVVGTRGNAFFGGRAVLWEAGVGVTDLGVLPSDAGSSASAINARGQVVGASRGPEEQCPQGSGQFRPGRAFLWQSGIGMVDLFFPAGDCDAEAFGVNDVGQVVGASGDGVCGDGGCDANATIWTTALVEAAGAPVVDRLHAAVLGPRNPTGLTGVLLRVRLADPGDPGPWDWRIEWGDGVTHAPQNVTYRGEFAFLRAAPYTALGPFTITVWATDRGGRRSAPAATEVSDPLLQLPDCTGPVALTVSPGTTPTFSWTPRCRLSFLTVRTADDASGLWSISPLIEANTIGPDVRYGIVPNAATDQFEGPVPLVPGTAYRVVVGTGGGLVAGEATFTP